MRYLLDTHVWLWQALDPDRLTRKSRRALENPTNELYLSPISVWETVHLERRGRLRLRQDARSWVRDRLADSPKALAELNHEVAALAASLGEGVGADPADRFLIATAIVHDLVLVTADERLRACRQVKILW
jgi:PIN domain nuclease of toxin-antitoxin system